jgi:defect in organelle trafficking protein DotA
MQNVAGKKMAINKCLLKPFLLLTLLLLSSSAFAVTSIFVVPPNDQSIYYLSYMFGSVGDVLAGSDNALLKLIIVYFNNAVLVLGGIIIIYSSVVSTVNTAHDGEVLGKKWNSVWTPLRAAFGFALLLPVKSKGYALIQVFLMWVVVQGVGAADYIWAEGVGAIQTGEAIVGTQQPNDLTYRAAQNVFNSQVCAIQAGLLNGQGDNVIKTAEQYDYGVKTLYPPDVCGNLKLVDASDDNATAMNIALDNFNDSLRLSAEQFVSDYNLGTLDNTEVIQLQTSIQNAVDNYTAAILAIASQNDPETNGANIAALEQAKQMGWISAGMYYFTLSQQQNQAVNYQLTDMMSPKTIAYTNNVETLELSLGTDQYSILQTTLQVSTKISTLDPINYQSQDEATQVFVDQLGDRQTDFVNLISTFSDAMSGGPDPLLQISHFGAVLAGSAILSWLVFSALMTGLAIATGFGCAFIPGCLVLQTFTSIMVAPLVVCVGALAVQGLIMEFYIPMIPFIVFSLAAIGWMILVIEAMVAAPMLAIGILHPEGTHEIWGRSEAGIMIIAGVFLRPALMIVGLFASIAFSRVAITIVSFGFGPVAGSILPDGGWGALTYLAGFAVMMGIYVTLVMAVYNRVFSLIYVIPDKIMRWVGHAGEQSTVEQDLQAARSGATEGAGKTQEAGQQAGEALTGAIKERTDAKRKKKAAEGETTTDSVQAGKKGNT